MERQMKDLILVMKKMAGALEKIEKDLYIIRKKLVQIEDELYEEIDEDDLK